jgi:nucleotide-binding universal stress UspA family protein
MHDIVVGVDGSDTARRAAATAAEMAAAHGVNLHMVVCAEPSAPVEFGVGSDRFHKDWRSEAGALLDEIAAGLPCESITKHVDAGDPAKMLCAEAERLDARAIVVGNRRVSGMSRLLGSVAGDVIRHATCDVLVANTTRVPS